MIRILVDSGSDYRPEECKEKGVELVPLQITMGGCSYLDSVELQWDDFYRMQHKYYDL